MPKFSIVIPTRGRSDKLKRATQSVLNQTFQDWECIVVNDGGPTPELPSDPRFILLEQTHLNKVYARNLGMEKSTGEWICWLDDDDAYVQVYLEVLAQYIEENPEYKLFNFGGIVYTARGNRGETERFNTSHLRDPFEHGQHEVFAAGHIATGHFIFHRSVYEDVGNLPPSTNPYLFADEMKKKYPELMDHYGPFYMQGGKELGNPWGDDFAMWFIVTRKYEHKTLPVHLYIQFCRL